MEKQYPTCSNCGSDAVVPSDDYFHCNLCDSDFDIQGEPVFADDDDMPLDDISDGLPGQDDDERCLHEDARTDSEGNIWCENCGELLQRAGLMTLTAAKSGETATIRLTEAGKQAIRDMPDDLHAEWFPLPIDIAEAKAKVS